MCARVCETITAIINEMTTVAAYPKYIWIRLSMKVILSLVCFQFNKMKNYTLIRVIGMEGNFSSTHTHTCLNALLLGFGPFQLFYIKMYQMSYDTFNGNVVLLRKTFRLLPAARQQNSKNQLKHFSSAKHELYCVSTCGVCTCMCGPQTLYSHYTWPVYIAIDPF